ncbi:MAG: phenylalanine--tRNA ligase subunit beta [Christensenellales bacterium]|jgi:phenylalanyl-tRNA synthetase beta chain
MLTPYNWLKQYVDLPELSAEDYAERMVMTGTEAESVAYLGVNFSGVVVGTILKIEKHPDSDHLQICQVDVGDEVLQIVTGADNVFEGAHVPVATPGAKLPEMTIKPTKMRGVASNGMLCSGEEMGITEEDEAGAGVYGIMILSEDTINGTDMHEALDWQGAQIDFKILANRPDCLSVIGLARESAAVFDALFKMPEVQVAETYPEDIHNIAKVQVEAPDLCPRYMARVVKNIKIAPSPRWMRRALTAAGMRPINNIVDITNYVMLEMGQPMHAFDLATVGENTIVVRRAKEGEKLISLDHAERVLTDRMLVIADPIHAVGLAGVMGGENSEITENTENVLLEAAVFDQAAVRGCARGLGLRTEASMRFEKGLDIENVALALDRAAQLIELLGAGEVVRGVIDVRAQVPRDHVIATTASRLNRYMGVTVETAEMVSILSRLGIAVTVEGDSLVCRIPSHRQDMDTYADLAEEILRIHGFDALPSLPMTGVAKGGLSREQKLAWKMRDTLCALGMDEIYTNSMTGSFVFDRLGLPEDAPERVSVPLYNGFGEEQNQMRTLLTPNMLQTLALNANRKLAKGCFYELDRVFIPKALPMTELPDEVRKLCLGVYGVKDGFFHLKGILETFARHMDLPELTFTAGGPDWLHPGRRAQITLGDMPVGVMGEVHPDVIKAYDAPSRACVAEMDVQTLLDAVRDAKKVTPPSKFQAVQRDLALVMDAKAPVGPLMALLKKQGGQYLESISVFDVYQGEQVGEGLKSVAFSITFRAEDHTLKDEEITRAMKKMTGAAERLMNAKLRS